MPLFQVTETGIQRVTEVSFAAEGVLERSAIQQWIRKNPGVMGESLLIVSEEFADWEDSRRRIDLLALDEDANLVIIELKRTEDGAHMELQAVRYAAMISAMRFEDVVSAFEEYLAKYEPGEKDQARARILQFLGAGQDGDVEISSAPRILLLSRDFSREITTTVLWLIEQGLGIRCLQMVPHKIGEQLLIDLRQVIPLAQAEDYQVRLRQKGEVTRQAVARSRREETLKTLARHGVVSAGTEIEIVPESRPESADGMDSSLFRARVGDLSRKKSIIWLRDGNPYSLSNLTWNLSQEHGVRWVGTMTALNWRIVGHTENLWNEAERLGRYPEHETAALRSNDIREIIDRNERALTGIRHKLTEFRRQAFPKSLWFVFLLLAILSVVGVVWPLAALALLTEETPLQMQTMLLAFVLGLLALVGYFLYLLLELRGVRRFYWVTLP